MKLVLLCLLASAMFGETYDLVLANGRVMDTETHLDAVRNVGIRGGKIAAVSASPLDGRRVIDVRGLVVTAGFIDLHSHGQTPENYDLKARDGVTTALEMEVGVNPLEPWYAARAGHARINFGATSGYLPARMLVMHDSGKFLPRDAATNRVATGEALAETLAVVRRGLDEGGLGIGLGIAYIPLASRQEIFELFELAAERRVPVYVHMRYSGPLEPGVVDGLQEMMADALATGASVHIVHISSMGLRDTPVLLRMIEGAQKHGLDITTEAYPYTAGMTDLSSAIFAEGWQARLGGIGFGDLQWALTGERLTEESFARYRKQGGMVAVHNIPEDVARMAIADPKVMIASDGLMEAGKGHPRAAGTYARVLGRYVREQHVLSLMDALRKMSLMPAQRLGIQSKGRLQVGADADIAVIDAEHVIDRATFEKPAEFSEGIRFILVNGVLVVQNGQLVDGAVPGIGLRR